MFEKTLPPFLVFEFGLCVIPAKAGIQDHTIWSSGKILDPRFRGGDKESDGDKPDNF